MSKFDEFINVAKEAKKNIDEMNSITLQMQNKIDQSYQDKFERMKSFWADVAQMMHELDINDIFIRTPLQQVCLYGTTPNFRLFLRSGQVMLGLFVGTLKQENFIRWIYLLPQYKDYASQDNCNPITTGVINDLFQNWELYEAQFTSIIKDAITEKMSNKIDAASDRYEQTKDALNSL